MTDATHDDDGRPEGLPAPRTYDPSGDAAPVAGEPGTVVLLLAGTASHGWAAEAAVGLSAAWSRGGGRVVLADLDVEDPILHRLTGGENLQGLVDVLMYGASVGSTARPVAGQAFYLIPAGTYEPDASSIYRHPRWEKLVSGFRDASASLVLFAPAGKPAVAEIAGWVDRVILLGEPGEAPALEALAAAGLSPDALLLPPARPKPATEGPEPLQEHGSESLEATEMMLPPEPARRGSRGRRRFGTVIAVSLAAAAFAIAGFLLARHRPDLIPWAGASDPAVREAAPVRQDRTGPSRTGAPLPYSVSGWAFMTFDAAQAHADQERTRFSSAPFFVSPEEIQGVLYYKVLAGAVVDTSAASRLRAQLIESGAVEPTESIIQFAPLAFDLGEFPREDDASERADSLALEDVPSYAVQVPYSDGTTRWQLYGGAYRDSVSAEAMRQRLGAAGIASRLIARIGEPAGAR